MPINALSIHRFHVNDDVTQLTKSAAAHSLNGLAQDISQDLKLAFIGKAGKQFGQFDRDAGACPLPAWLAEYLEKKQSFHAFSERFADHLQLQMAQSVAHFDGFLLLLHETLADEDCIYLYLLQHEGGIYIDPAMQLADAKNIDVRGLRAGVKISITEWQATEPEPYLTMLRARGEKPLSEAFEAAVGFADPVDHAAQTSAFLQLVERYSANLHEEQAVACKKKVADFCIEQDKSGKAIEIATLSQQISDEEPAAFERFVIEAAPEAPAQFYADRKQMRQFVRISGRTDQLSLSFSSECLGQTVVYDPGSDTLVLKEIPPALKARLIKFVQQINQGD
ncbi:nucleoid-associated protein [Simiduia aestuariiviva]|uniref:Nucleoid-associated protein n=1 Tax=Simiduia aestuariiviva TaxID=1510459 RepID=A0A839US02_9GAMM|nr:nucleoid-associated protein [Simiduia aestuariiviva]MBB3168165.1 nucleoid-associated protein [Simiduia aestuariiviva]